MKQVTRWGDPHKHIDSEYGDITYRQWSERECKRIDKNKCFIKSDEKGKSYGMGK